MPIISGGGGVPVPLSVNGAAQGSAVKVLDVLTADQELSLSDNSGLLLLATTGTNPVITVQDNANPSNGGGVVLAQDNQSFRSARLASGASAGDQQLALNDGNVNRVVLSDTLFMLRINTDPGATALSANQLTLWFDATNGASKLMIRAKSANGTSVTGSVSLA